ncbi:SDR family oxidoreductase [Candidatus Parcubacteria bacterium]|nr:SDR family oxidoreductase [Candidatus Parcubacteria bacterium]
MRVVVTGNLGYIGSVLAPFLAERGITVTGIDTGFYPSVGPLRQPPARQLYKDIRDVTEEDLRGHDALIHLAALSNDPTGELNSSWTQEINFLATQRLAVLAKAAGVGRFLFSSSCSVYGSRGDELMDEASAPEPVSEYAKSKVLAEQALLGLVDERFCPVILRNGTAHGASPRMRFDLAINNMVAHALAFGTVKILSDGTAWRPFVHIRDIAQAFFVLLHEPTEKVHGKVFNVGWDAGNVRVIDIATQIESVLGAHIEFSKDPQRDPRSYRVSFLKIQTLGTFQPEMTIEKSIREIVGFLTSLPYSPGDFEKDVFHNIAFLKKAIAEQRVDSQLRLV